mmetsp:Transcript_32638/g.76496  ORF Transcript_32638/g.76496 Transcript_32638/m.76496 type:complete len:249 (-) Transcript_32638:46-792(-)|eukprot:CAMPEP_0178401698 /NCGR_PEP_ID=MMETSP0689_2-20121128/16438_1 /TAXON_ID=160604 /ORGANISM="Amphidinium massartii, Strain CS-259" /LENGTH=248 /DNA_ID=CAMNT_0020022531 /DNA_START=96 /DNA_END=842 /DNA_ORIENTATION=-
MASAGAQSCRVFVGNLDWKVSWQDLKDHMRQAGEVVYADIFEERNGRSKGCAVVEYKTPQDAETAVEKLNDTQLGERLIFIREDREEPRAKGLKGGGGKGGYGGYGKGKSDYGGKGYDYYDGGKSKGYGGKSKGKGKGKDGYGKSKGGGYGYGSNAYISPLRVGPQDKGRLVYAGNLPFRAAWQDVKDVFKAYGEVIRVDVAEDQDGRSKGYATILFEKEEEAQAAIDALNDSDFQGRKMLVRMDNFL